jgi:hypothetical protein
VAEIFGGKNDCIAAFFHHGSFDCGYAGRWFDFDWLVGACS